VETAPNVGEAARSITLLEIAQAATAVAARGLLCAVEDLDHSSL
jgi:hypothetical protein